jgi:hypothetical protein
MGGGRQVALGSDLLSLVGSVGTDADLGT